MVAQPRIGADNGAAVSRVAWEPPTEARSASSISRPALVAEMGSPQRMESESPDGARQVSRWRGNDALSFPRAF